MAGLRGIAGAEQLARRARAEGARGGQVARPSPFARSMPDALAVCAEAWAEALRARNYSADTLETRRAVLRFFMAWAAERDVTRAGEVTRPVLEAFQRWLAGHRRANGRTLGWSTQRERLGVLRDWFRWLTRQNVILHNPASEIELPRPEHRLPPEPLTAAELARLLAVPDTADPLGLRDRAMLETLYATGLRRAELCRLQMPDVSPERGTLTVRQGKGKKDRVVPLGARAALWIARYLAEARPRLALDAREHALFLTGYGGPFNPDVLSRMVSAWLKAAGFTRKGSCHLLRHTCATHMHDGGADIRFIQQQLGHARLDTTAIYTEVSIRQLLDVHARCHPAGRVENASLPT
jgi:integrase/recombinase XerD